MAFFISPDSSQPVIDQAGSWACDDPIIRDSITLESEINAPLKNVTPELIKDAFFIWRQDAIRTGEWKEEFELNSILTQWPQTRFPAVVSLLNQITKDANNGHRIQNMEHPFTQWCITLAESDLLTTPTPEGYREIEKRTETSTLPDILKKGLLSLIQFNKSVTGGFFPENHDYLQTKESEERDPLDVFEFAMTAFLHQAHYERMIAIYANQSRDSWFNFDDLQKILQTKADMLDAYLTYDPSDEQVIQELFILESVMNHFGKRHLADHLIIYLLILAQETAPQDYQQSLLWCDSIRLLLNQETQKKQNYRISPHWEFDQLCKRLTTIKGQNHTTSQDQPNLDTLTPKALKAIYLYDRLQQNPNSSPEAKEKALKQVEHMLMYVSNPHLYYL